MNKFIIIQLIHNYLFNCLQLNLLYLCPTNREKDLFNFN